MRAAPRLLARRRYKRGDHPFDQHELNGKHGRPTPCPVLAHGTYDICWFAVVMADSMRAI